MLSYFLLRGVKLIIAKKYSYVFFQRTVWKNNLKRSLELVLYFHFLEQNTKRHVTI